MPPSHPADYFSTLLTNTGLEYLRARYYNASKGRFFQEDTYLGNLTDPLTLNRYAYVKNSPLNYIDPSGHWGSSYAASYQGDSEDYNPIPSYAASHDSYGNGVPEVKSSGFSSALEEAMDNAAEIGKATKRYCDSYVAGMRVSAYVKDAELENILIMLIPFKEPISEAEMNARINEILDEVKDFDYVAFRDGMIDGELLHYRAYLYMARRVDNMMGSMFAGSGTYVATAVTPDGYLIEVEVVGELVSEAILEGAVAGVAAGVLAIGNGYEGDSKPSNKPYKNNKEANKQAQKQGYKDAHELKADYVGKGNVSKYDMKYDTKTGEIYLENKDGTIQIPTGLIHEP